jgi:cell division protein FtsN
MTLLNQNLLLAVAFAIVIGIMLGAKSTLIISNFFRYYFGGHNAYGGYNKYGNRSKYHHSESAEKPRSSNSFFGFFLFTSVGFLVFFLTKSAPGQPKTNAGPNTVVEQSVKEPSAKTARNTPAKELNSNEAPEHKAQTKVEQAAEESAVEKIEAPKPDQFKVQFGSFEYYAGVEKIMDKLKPLGIALHCTNRVVNGKELFVVFAGPFSKKKAESVKRKSALDAIIVPFEY